MLPKRLTSAMESKPHARALEVGRKENVKTRSDGLLHTKKSASFGARVPNLTRKMKKNNYRPCGACQNENSTNDFEPE